MKPCSKAIILLCSLFLTATLHAQTETYRARLSPMPVSPQTVNTITGQGEVILTSPMPGGRRPVSLLALWMVRKYSREFTDRLVAGRPGGQCVTFFIFGLLVK